VPKTVEEINDYLFIDTQCCLGEKPTQKDSSKKMTEFVHNVS